MNWFVQLMYVYYDEVHEASVLGAERAKEHISLINSEFGDIKLLVGIKEGSMVPHDPINKRNEAMELWGAQGIDPITFFDRLEFPNPRESAKQLFLWMSDPVQLFPDLMQAQQQAMMMAQQQQQQTMQQQQQGEQQRMQEQQKVEREGKQIDNENQKQQIALKGLVQGLIQKGKPA